MTSILKLRGAPALSSSRQERLSRAVGEVLPRFTGLAAEHWYFVEVSAPLNTEETARLVEAGGWPDAVLHPPADTPLPSPDAPGG